MSIQALAWVFEQDIPSRAKQVLFALANHADHVTGHCFPSIDTIMKESSCSRQAVFNFMSLLKRNGFIDRRPRTREDGSRRSNDYWLLFDRPPARWISSFREENSPDEPESETMDGEGTHSGVVENLATNPPCVPGESAPCTPIYEPSDSNRQNLQLKDGQALKLNRPKDFSSNKRAYEQAKLQAAEEARKAERIFVFEGSEPWKAWQKAKAPYATPIHTRKEDGRRGWWFPSLYPPKQSTGPPTSPLMTPDDEDELQKWG